MSPKDAINESESKMKKIFIALLLTLFFSHTAFALETYKINFSQSRIDGSIHYTVVGKYRAIFEDFGGTVYVDPNTELIKGVKLIIKTASIKSKAPNLDNIVKSPQLLNAERYPEIIYESFDVQPDDDGQFQSVGHLDLHGVIRRLDSLFTFEGPMRDEQGRSFVRVKGEWVFHRKDYNIIWNRFLDKGGILVGNHITVDWEIIAYQI